MDQSTAAALPRGPIDDWHLVGCKLAVENYRERHGIDDEINVRDANAFWVKQQDNGWPAT